MANGNYSNMIILTHWQCIDVLFDEVVCLHKQSRAKRKCAIHAEWDAGGTYQRIQNQSLVVVHIFPVVSVSSQLLFDRYLSVGHDVLGSLQIVRMAIWSKGKKVN